MHNKCLQISLFDIYNGISTSIEEKKPELISLLDDNIDFNALISYNFHHNFYSYTGRKHKYHLISFVKSLILAKLLGFSDSQLIAVLKCSSELRDFCEFDKVPDASYFSRFKHKFCDNLAELFENLVSVTEPICREIDAKKADYLIYDTTGIEPNVTENNPKFLNTKLKELKKISKNTSYNPYVGVYKTLPDCASSNSCVKQQYVNGHYCYAFKTGILTNGLVVVRHISFFDDFKNSHPEIITQKSDKTDVDKEISDSVSLKPVLSDFFASHSDFSYKTFIGDSAFDSYDTYTMLKKEFCFERSCIPLNQRNQKKTNLNRHRVVIERTINLLKDSFGIGYLKTQNTKTVKSELYLSGITQLLGVVLAKAIHKPEYFKSIRKLMSSVA